MSSGLERLKDVKLWEAVKTERYEKKVSSRPVNNPHYNEWWDKIEIGDNERERGETKRGRGWERKHEEERVIEKNERVRNEGGEAREERVM